MMAMGRLQRGLPILLLLIAFHAPRCNGFSSSQLPVRFSAVVKAAGSLVTPSSLAATLDPLKGDGEEKSTNRINNDNTDDVRRARSLARRGRLARLVAAAAEEEDDLRDTQDNYFLLGAFVPVILAFMSWENISFGVSEFINTYGVMNTPDGNKFANDLLRPTITGVVMPVISIALATLVSTTVNVLRQRQVDLRAFVNKESCELRLLRRAIFGIFGTRQHAGRRAKALALLSGYVEQLMKECDRGAVDELEERQLVGGIGVNELDRLSAMLHGVDGAAASRQGSVSAADDLIVSLNGHRSERVALLLSVFPVIHWGILIGLSMSITIAFLLTSNQQVLQYLNSIQLRFLFATIIGVFSSVGILCWDLSDTFSGTFSIVGAGTQLADLRVCIREDAREALAEDGEISSSTRNFLQSAVKRSDVSGKDGSKQKFNSSQRYGILSTVYFHLLTGPLGSNVRAIGDAAAWLASILGSRWRAIKKWRLELLGRRGKA